MADAAHNGGAGGAGAGADGAGTGGHLFSPRNVPLSMLSPAIARNRGILGHAVTILQSPGYAMKALADGINKVDHALGASLPENPGCLTKVHFRVNHPPSRPQVDDVEVKMHLLGSLRQMGSWEELRAKTMKRCTDGWEIVCYLNTGETFEYQYILKDYDGVPVWRSSAERQQTVDDIGGNNTLEIIDFITTGEEETGNLYNQAASSAFGSSAVRALPPTPRDLKAMESTQHDDSSTINLPECPAGVDVGRDSTCALPRDSLLPPPTSQFSNALPHQSDRASHSGFEDCRRASVMQSSTPFEDCRQWLTAPPDSPSGNTGLHDSAPHAPNDAAVCGGAPGVGGEGMADEEELNNEETSTDSPSYDELLSRQKAATEAKQQRLDLAAKQISSIVALVLQADASFLQGEGGESASEAVKAATDPAESEEEDTQDMLTLALTNLREVLEKRRVLQLEEQAQEQKEQGELGREDEQAQALDAERNAVQQQLTSLEQQLAALDAEYKEAQQAHEQALALKEQEVKNLELALEEERQLIKMRSRRLRGGIRAAQGQLSSVRSGFDDLKAEVAKMSSEIVPELAGMSALLSTSIVSVAQGLQADLDETNGKFEGEVRERKRLHNLVQELKGNIRVFARIRPISQSELARAWEHRRDPL